MKKGKLFVISGPSGVGKDTIVNEYLKENYAHLSVSATTRNPREGEIHGIHYYFYTNEEFEDRIKKGDFLEYATYNNCYYGTPKSKIEEKLNEGINVILVIEVQGAKKVKELIKESVLIFILPPSIEELEERLKVRNLDSEEMIQNRLKIAEEEIKEAGFYDYVLVNKDVKGAVNKLKMIIDEEVKLFLNLFCSIIKFFKFFISWTRKFTF